MNGLACIPALKALSEKTRLRMLRLLYKEPLRVTEVSEKLGVSQYNVSKHLRVMREAGFLEVHKRGKHRLYSVLPTLKAEFGANEATLDLGWCIFRLDRLPK